MPRDNSMLNTGTSPAAQRYAAYRDQQGWGAQGGVGITGKPGKYAGLPTMGMLNDAILGRAKTKYQSDQQAANQLMADASQRRQTVTGQVDTERGNVKKLIASQMVPSVAYSPDTSRASTLGTPRSGIIGGLIGKAADSVRPVKAEMTAHAPMAVNPYADYQSYLDDHLQSQGEIPASQDEELASYLSGTPLSEYARDTASSEYGLDPNVAAGMFDTSVDTQYAADQRDAQSMAEFGVPYNEYVASQRTQASQMEDDQKLYDDQMNEQLYSAVSERVGMDAKALANAADMTMEQVAQVVADPSYDAAAADLEAAAAEGDPTRFAEALTQAARGNPAAYRVLEAQYAGYVPTGYSPYGG